MTNRERALTIANSIVDQIENQGKKLVPSEALVYALILVLADISEQLEEIKTNIADLAFKP